MTIKLTQNYPQFFELNGTALNDGYIYIGVDGLDPTTNPKTVYTDEALTIPIAQPLRTTGGYIYSGGSPVSIYLDSPYSITVKNSLSEIIYTNLHAYDYLNTKISFKDGVIVKDTIAQLKTVNGAVYPTVEVLGYYVKGDLGGGLFYWDSTSTETDNGGTVIQATGISTGRFKRVFRGAVNVKWFGAKGDGVTDDTVAIQKAVDSSSYIIVSYGEAGIYKITNAIFFNVAGKTLEFENNYIVFKKFYNGNCIVVNSAYTKLINVGINGNAPAYQSGGIEISNAITYYTYECSIINPRIFNTLDSCIIFNGVQSGSGIVISEGHLTTYNSTGDSSNGYPAIRKIGKVDTDACPRKITDVDSSSTPLIDLTGMVTTFIKGGQCATILFGGNPDVTDATYISAKAIITGVRIRDGFEVQGEDHSFSSIVSHGYAPQYSSYGVLTTPLLYGMVFSSNSRNCSSDSSCIITNHIRDYALGLGDICNKFFSLPASYNMQWTASVTNPNIGNGSIISTYSVSYNKVKVFIGITMGSTTTFGSGIYSFSLPFQAYSNILSIGNARVFNQGVNGAEWGLVNMKSFGSPSMVEVYSTTGSVFSSTVPHTFKANDYIWISFEYIRL